ncbi:Down syndrome cell adhesion molecule-like isoform X3 [Actinia tenebrosa]|uniref:Down syndrome cell adhesion molecule-like isoform X2 n=1 Tax=Actinia tenebrosa TaxID=6105 RepID=A0A6P8I5J2_ACTTE|nr:Down syndrome cell adhesion molecule-like isoform X2 [Actinia tenebrosa]XP_031560015.1 Down syndrome cell adhesion molecule-like isoform X3 [Actinia tenebrosa]
MRYFYIEAIALLISLVTLSKGIQWFNREPPSVLYVSSGGTARIVWDYDNRNRTAMFDPYSPEWALYNTSGFRIVIGVEDGYNGWKFIISKQCPPKLRGRVSKESTATLVISNVTKADERLYECSLLLLAEAPTRSKVQLVVTERPRFTTPVNLSTPINEGSSLCIRCSAAADPMPNVTWVRIIKNPTFISDGVGEAFLRFTNITRHQRGTYECQATNNPNEDPVRTRTEILVKYPVEPANVFVSDIKATSAVIKWDSPVDDGGSPVIEYKVQINTIPPREAITETTYCVTNDLNENTTYDVKVYARNAVGYGKAVCTEFTTKEPKRKAVKEMILNEETDDIVKSPVASIYAGVIGVIIWIGLISMAILVVFIKKIWVKKGKEQRQVRLVLSNKLPWIIYIYNKVCNMVYTGETVLDA